MSQGELRIEDESSPPCEGWKLDPSLRFLLREGEMRQRIREFDWSGTGLGDMVHWPGTLKTALSIMLDSATASYMAWGERYYQFYNDAYIAVLGPEKHREAIGKTTPETWHEIWDFVGPLFAKVMQSGQAIWMENQLFPMLRNGYLEECYFSFSYSPLSDEQGHINGIFATVWETTEAYIENRRRNVLRLLTQQLAQAEEIGQVQAAFQNTISSCSEDLPFGLWYARSADGTGFELLACAGIRPGSQLAPAVVGSRDTTFYARLMRDDLAPHQDCEVGEDLVGVSCDGQAKRSPRLLKIERLRYGNYPQADAYLVLAVNPMRPYDASQKDFLEAISIHMENTLQRINRLLAQRQEQAHQFQAVMAVLPCLVWFADIEGKCTFVNQAWIGFTGRTFDEQMGEGWLSQVHPDDLETVKQRCRDSLKSGGELFEFRLRSSSNSYRWFLSRTLPRHDIYGNYLGCIGTCLDINDRKAYEQMIVLSQQELHSLYDLLQKVREEERRALAREVHDQLGQVLSAAKIDIKLLETEVAGRRRMNRQWIRQELNSAQHAVEKSIEIVRRLAHELRPPELESQGLAEAIQWHLKDFERRTKMRCEVQMPPDLHRLDKRVGVALFGIFQEALTNILRHAHASLVQVSLERGEGLLRFQVRDDGVGATRIETDASQTLGLTGMRERAASVGATLEVQAAHPSGTAIVVTIPLSTAEPAFQVPL